MGGTNGTLGRWIFWRVGCTQVEKEIDTVTYTCSPSIQDVGDSMSPTQSPFGPQKEVQLGSHSFQQEFGVLPDATAGESVVGTGAYSSHWAKGPC